MTSRSEFGFWMFALGTLASAISLISLVQKIFNVGLISVFADFVEFYRRFTYPLFNSVLFFTSWRPPSWYMDLYLLSLVACIAMFRGLTAVLQQREGADHVRGRIALYGAPLLFSAMLSIPLLGIPLMLAALAFSTDRLMAVYDVQRHKRSYEPDLLPALAKIRTGVFVMLAAVAVFFGTNAMF